MAFNLNMSLEQGSEFEGCLTANVENFLKTLQEHIFEYGIFQCCFSDLGSQIQACANLIAAFLGD